MRVFASASEEPRARRPTDVMLLVGNVFVLGVLIVVGRSATEAERAAVTFFGQLPGLLDTLWQLSHDAALLWALGLVLLAGAAHRRLPLLRDELLAAVGAGALGLVAHALVEHSWPSLLEELTASGGPARFPAVRLAVESAVIITASPHLSRPLRYTGRWVVAGATVSTLALGLASPGGVAGSLAIAGVAATVVHLVFGSPGGRPSLREVAAALTDLGVDAVDLQPADLQPEGVWTVVGTSATGAPLTVKVYGRDAWDGQLAVSVWRLLWYRNTEASLAVTRIQQVEHEAFLTLLAGGAGLPVPKVLAAGEARSGDALLALSADAVPLDRGEAPDDGLLADLWTTLDRAHRTGISPGQIDPGRLGRDACGRAVILDWVAGQTAPSTQQELQDGAQMLVSMALLAGDDRAIASAIDVLGPERFGELLAYLQPASLSMALRRAVRDRGHDLEALRAKAAQRVNVETPKLVRLRRVTVGTVVQAALLLLAATALVEGLTSLDLASVSDELRAMALGAVIVGFVLAQVARASGAMSTLGASAAPLPVGPVVELQFAIGYINMAVPSSAGRLAMVMRFYQRVGSTAATALGASALDSFANFLIQVVLVVVTLGFGLGSIELSLSSSIAALPPNLVRFVVLIAVGLVIAAGVSLFIPRVRTRVKTTVRQFRDGLRVLRSPSKVASLIGGNLLTQVFYALSLGACVAATGNHVGLADLLLVTNLVGTFASIIPVPNGIGVTEAGLTAGLVAAGIPDSAAFAAVLVYRVLSAYIPPIWGFFAMRALERQNYL